MPKGPKVPVALRRQWLEAHEHGQRIDEIARSAHHTDRTVKDHIERARQEREQQQVRAGLLREGYQRHFDDLLGAAQRLRQQVNPPTVLGEPTPDEVRERLLVDGLRRHLPRAPLWKALERRTQAAQELNEFRSELESSFLKRVSSVLAPLLPSADAREWFPGLWYAAEQAADDRGLDHVDYRRIASNTGTDLVWGSFGLARGVLDEPVLEQLEAGHRTLVEAVGRDPVVGGIRMVKVRQRQALATITTEVETLLLRRLVPGQCPLCPG